MRREYRWLFLAGVLIVAIGLWLISGRKEDKMDQSANRSAGSNGMSLSSPQFSENAEIPAAHTCKGENTNPPLAISGVPDTAKSLALILHDPDAVSSDFTHWLLWDMPASTKSIGANSVPVGAVQGKNGGGQNRYMGPCPPAGTGTHRYMFELYALDKSLGLPAGTGRADLEQAIDGHALAHTRLTGLFSAD